MAAAYMLVTSWAAAFSRVGIGPQAQDSLSQPFVDSVVVKSPLPDPLIPVVQWIFQKPGWVMAGGIVLGAIVALAVLLFLWRRRRVMAGAVGAVLLLVVGTGVKAEEDPPQSRTDVSASPSDTFPHKRHSRLACLTCHDLRSKRRPLTFEAPRGCQICHHQRPAASDCSVCHQDSELAEPKQVTVQVAVSQHPRRAREVDFAHQSHRDVACVKCHQTPASLAPTPEAADCSGCHEDHHTADRDCATCHRTAQIVTAHQPPVDAHLACNQCHTSATVAALTPSRSFCLACHDPKVNHYEPKECTVCHLQATPEGYRARLTGAGSRR